MIKNEGRATVDTRLLRDGPEKPGTPRQWASPYEAQVVDGSEFRCADSGRSRRRVHGKKSYVVEGETTGL